jgi:uncharacterized protein
MALAPGIYIQEFAPNPIEGVATSVTGFVGVAQRAPAVQLTSFAQFEAQVGAAASTFLRLSVRGFFENGGQTCYVARIAPGDPLQSGLEALANDKISIVCCPDDANFPNAGATMAAYCEKLKDRMCILQPAQAVVPDAANQPPVKSSYAAYYYPWLSVPSLDGSSTVSVPPCGYVAGIYANTDTTRGVWTAPAGSEAVLAGVSGLSQILTDAEAAALDGRGVSVLRDIAPDGFIVWGGRTTSSGSAWQYVNVRRLMIYIEQSLNMGLQWAVFEPNGPGWWAAVRSGVESFLMNLWESGGLKGTTAQEAYFVRCDPTTVTQADIAAGRLVAVVGVAPLEPAEFVILQITCVTKQTA